MKRLKQLPEFVRFVMVGIFATALHYGLYFVLQWVINVNIAYTLGYALSFIANFYLTAYFTFGRSPHGEKPSDLEEHTYAAICYTWGC